MIGDAANSENIKTLRIVSESKKKDLESPHLSHGVLYLLFFGPHKQLSGLLSPIVLVLVVVLDW